MRWPRINELYANEFRKNSAFSADAAGNLRWSHLHSRVTEHNIRVVAGYYSRISTNRLSLLLDLPVAECERYLSELVVKGTIWARIDRPAARVVFRAAQESDLVLNTWSASVGKVLDLIGRTRHLISKEEMVAAAFSDLDR